MADDIPKYEDSTEVPKYEDSHEIPPSYEDSTPVEQPPNYEDSTPISQKYDPSTLAGNLKAGAEGAYEGLTMGFGPHLPGMGAKGEALEANPIAHTVGQVVGTVANPINYIPLANPIVRNAIQAGAFATGDELHDYLSGQKHLSNIDDDKVAAMHILGAGAMGSLLGKGEKFVGEIANKFAPKLEQLAQGIGASGHELTPAQLEQLGPLAKRAYTVWRKIVPAAENKAISAVGAAPLAALTGGAGYAVGSNIDDLMGNEHHQVASGLGSLAAAYGTKKGYDLLQPLIQKSVTPFVDASVKKVLSPVILKALSVGHIGSVPEAASYAAKAAKGQKILKNAMDGLFSGVKTKGTAEATDPRHIEAVKQYIDDGGINPSIDATVQQDNAGEEPANYAEGGQVSKQDQPDTKSLNSKLQHVYPEQHLLNVQNKTKVSNYLQQLKPKPKVGGPIFDRHNEDPIAHKSYERAIHAAIDPTRILEHARKGSLVPEHVKHMNSMYPGVMNTYRNEITKRLMAMQLKGEKPPLKLRQSLSMIMGTDLDSTTTQPYIAAAQATFATRQSPQQQPAKKDPAKSTAKLDKMAQNDTTASQAGTARRQGAKS